MRALAEFVMRGRVQAISVAIAGVVLPFCVWVSAAVIGLVTLRRSAQDAVVVLGWGVLAAMAMLLWQGDPGPVVALIGTAAAAWVLRLSRSWPYALVAIVIAGLLSALVLSASHSGFVAMVTEKLNELFVALRTKMSAEQAALLGEMTTIQVSGLLGIRSAALIIIALLIARWWQAMLYNPGGFREEFHRLRLPGSMVIGLIAAGLLIAQIGSDYQIWTGLFTLPFVVAGVALVHGLVGTMRWGRGPLIVLYIAWLVALELVTGVLVLMALVDSWWDFRGRLIAKQKRQQ
ncbi:MAG: hypothetical protein QM709_16685 [Spongiibacteraceae bacterium]